MMMKWTTSQIITAVLAISSSTAIVNGKLDPQIAGNTTTTPATTTVYVPIDLAAALDAITATEPTTTSATTTTTSSRAAQWGTLATVTSKPTVSPTSSPTTSPTSSPTKRIPEKGDILPLCQTSLSSAVTFDTDDSSALDKHEFSDFIESSTGSSAATVILNEASDKLYKELRKACATVFKLPSSCYDETTTTDDGTDNNSGNSEFIHDGVLLVGFTKTWEEKQKVEKDYEKFFCNKLIEFHVMNGVSLDWTLVDGITVDATNNAGSAGNSTMVIFDDASNNSTEVAEVTEDIVDESSVNNTVDATEIVDPEAVDWAALADFVAEATSEVGVTSQEEDGEEGGEEVVGGEDESTITNTASEINAADTSFVQSNTINEQQSSANAMDTIPTGGWIGIGLGGVLLVFLVAALIVTTKRRRSRNTTNRQANNGDDSSIWSDEENNMMRGAGGAPLSSVSAIGMASTVVTRLTTGDTEVTLMKKQPWTEREPVI